MKRYRFDGVDLVESPDGRWVKHESIEALEAEVERRMTGLMASWEREAVLKVEFKRLTAEVERLRHEMRRYLPVLEALEANPSSWEWFTDSTGIATLSGYRHAINGFPTTPEQEGTE